MQEPNNEQAGDLRDLESAGEALRDLLHEGNTQEALELNAALQKHSKTMRVRFARRYQRIL